MTPQLNGFDGLTAAVLARLPMGRLWLRLQPRLAAFADQGFQGTAGILSLVIFARSLPPQEFGLLGMALGIHFFLFGLHRCALVLPFIVINADTAVGAPRQAGSWSWLNLASVIVIGAALPLMVASLTPILPKSGRLGDAIDALMLTCCMTPFLVTAEFARRVLFQAERAASAALTSLVFCVVLIASALLLAKQGTTAERAAWCWAAAGLAASIGGYLLASPGPPSIRPAVAQWLSMRGFVAWQCLNSLPYTIANSSLVAVVGAFGGAGAAAAFNIARTVANPATAIASAVDSIDKPRAARAFRTGGVAALATQVRRTRGMLLIAAGSYLGLVVVFAEPILGFVFGQAHASAPKPLQLLAGAFLLMVLNQPSETALTVLNAGRAMFLTRIIAAAATLVGLWIALPYGTVGAAIAVVVAQVLNMGILLVVERLAYRKEGGSGS